MQIRDYAEGVAREEFTSPDNLAILAFERFSRPSPFVFREKVATTARRRDFLLPPASAPSSVADDMNIPIAGRDLITSPPPRHCATARRLVFFTTLSFRFSARLFPRFLSFFLFFYFSFFSARRLRPRASSPTRECAPRRFSVSHLNFNRRCVTSV